MNTKAGLNHRPAFSNSRSQYLQACFGKNQSKQARKSDTVTLNNDLLLDKSINDEIIAVDSGAERSVLGAQRQLLTASGGYFYKPYIDWNQMSIDFTRMWYDINQSTSHLCGTGICMWEDTDCGLAHYDPIELYKNHPARFGTG